MSDAPQISIVICTRNRAAQLDGALASLRAIRGAVTWEALLVDNASTDDTARVIAAACAEDSRLRYLAVDRIGLGAGRDAAWRETRGEIIAFTDDDCYVAPNFVDALAEVFAEDAALGCVGGRIVLHDPTDARVTIDERTEAVSIDPRQFIDAGTLHGANLSFRRAALAEAGGFDPQFGAGTPFPCEDIDAVARVLWAGRGAKFDPRPEVRHHHGRKAGDVSKLLLSYDAGRGAYYAKFVLRPDTRAAYLQAWRGVIRRRRGAAMLGRTVRELKSAAAYMAMKGRTADMVRLAPSAALALARVCAQTGLSATRARLSRRA